MTPPFIIFGLPRSRTFWLSRFLTYGAWHCGHDEVRHARGLDDVRSWLSQPCTGTAETAAAHYWRIARQMAPDARVVVVRRPVADAVRSLARLGIGCDEWLATRELNRLDRKLEQVGARWPGALRVNFADLNNAEVCGRIFEHCLSMPFDESWYAKMAPLNLQADQSVMLRYFQANLPQLEKLRDVARHAILADFTRKPSNIGAMTYQQEPFDSAMVDAEPLMRAHCVEVGESPDSWQRKNWSQMRMLEKVGCVQVTTARSNGRMFGYLLAIISPSLEAQESLMAVHTSFYVSPSAPGIGLKLHRASVAALRARGVSEVHFRAGTRGAGLRTRTLFRRMGAEFAGETYRLDLRAA